MTVKLADIEDARRTLANVILPTPMIADDRLSREIGANAHLKAECLQKSGSFKIRGAYNKISQLSDDEKRRGVVRSEEHTSELQSPDHLVCRLLLEKKKTNNVTLV